MGGGYSDRTSVRRRTGRKQTLANSGGGEQAKSRTVSAAARPAKVSTVRAAPPRCKRRRGIASGRGKGKWSSGPAVPPPRFSERAKAASDSARTGSGGGRREDASGRRIAHCTEPPSAPPRTLAAVRTRPVLDSARLRAASQEERRWRLPGRPCSFFQVKSAFVTAGTIRPRRAAGASSRGSPPWSRYSRVTDFLRRQAALFPHEGPRDAHWPAASHGLRVMERPSAQGLAVHA
ncbi:hypothetical protein MRX96_029428 [Rhipicephalus microplus]